jgi:hypothetical protein
VPAEHEDQSAVAVRADDRRAAEVPDGSACQGTQVLHGIVAGHRPSPSGRPSGGGGSTSVSRRKALSKISAGDRAA